jgi:hypothetical protein
VHIENGTPRLPDEVTEAPVYVQHSPAAAAPVNSYRKYLLWEQQQQQQQQ